LTTQQQRGDDEDDAHGGNQMQRDRTERSDRSEREFGQVAERPLRLSVLAFIRRERQRGRFVSRPSNHAAKEKVAFRQRQISIDDSAIQQFEIGSFAQIDAGQF